MKKYSKCILLIILSICLILFLPGCAEMEINLNSDGSGNAMVTVYKEALKEKGINTEEELKIAVENLLLDFNTDWTIQRVKLKSIKQTDETFILQFKLARIQNLENVGKYEFSTTSEFTQNSNTRKLLTNWMNGKFDKLEYTGGKLVSFGSTDFRLTAKNFESGETVNSDLLESAMSESDLRIFAFLNYDVGLISQITLNIPGKVKYYSGEGLEVTNNGRTVIIRPQTFEINITEIIGTTVNKETREAQNYVGFIVYDETIALPLLLGLVVLGLGVATLLFFAIKKRWFKKLIQSHAIRYVKKEYAYYLMILPGIILLAIFCYGPMVGIYTAFTNYSADEGIFGSEFVGLQNFINMFDHRWKFGQTLRNTFVIALLKFVVGYPASVILALLFTYLFSKTLKSIMQTVSYLPYFLSWVMISGIAYNFLTSNNGILNRVLEFFGKEPIKWYSDPTHWWSILTITSVWKGMGYGTITFLAGLSAINSELYEAASIDGASKFRQVFTVTLPGLMPVISFTLILNMGNLIKDDYEQIIALAGENNAYLQDTVTVLGSAVFNSLSSVDQYSSGTAMGFFQSVISLILVTVSNHILVKRDQPGIW